ncbi:MAG: CoA transferase [Candidatus Bipolaricaulota bacterium]|nr:CoA transferase [Candidatus Bipolaricaulota bacterium]MCS7273952.1 CoA transferase [Candidatus Bipolaricaulota bacterium]MDW8111024.1 CaiB/BaiF CoA-transferase family protein [Candidatus Bipolaricaulota bacterium]MDW8329277.1 CaiB/BaiF CoA-transferase family protein [Candidatus Bipolaricaulota bacterium]
MYKLLDEVRILDLTRLLPGPYATLLLADLGAHVIKIEDPKEGDPVRALSPRYRDGTSYLFHLLHRNKASVALNLKSQIGREILLKLAQTADVLIEGFRPGVTARLGIEYAAVRAVKPDIIYCSVTGYGQDGPYSEHVGHDLNYISLAGILGLTGREEPVIPGVPIADLIGGALAAFYIVAALQRRARTGAGAYIDLSLTDAALSLMTLHWADYVGAHRDLKRGQLPLGGYYACYAVYKTKDGRFLSLACLEPKFWQAFCERVQRPEWVGRPFDPSLKAEVQRLIETRSLEEWLSVLDPKQVPITPVYEELREIWNDPHLRRRRLWVEGLEQLAAPARLAEVRIEGDRLAPALGQQTEEVLRELGIAPDAIARWRAEGVIA